MGKDVTIGGQRLGSGKRMTTNLKSYERSTHNLGYLWRSSMAPGTLVPFMVEPALPGDTWDIGLASEVLTLPTVGPLFGSFKLQLDVFQVPIRLYQAQLHNNKLYIGLNMDQIKLPLIELTANTLDFTSETPLELQQISQSSLLAYLGIRGLGKSTTWPTVTRQFDATPLLAYWDIYKNYYANKQEEVGYYIHKQGVAPAITQITDGTQTQGVQVDGTLNNEMLLADETTYTVTGTNLTHDFNLTVNGSVYPVMALFATVSVNAAKTQATLSNLYPPHALKELTKINGVYDNSPVALREFNLSNLDDMREDILAEIKSPTAFIIKHTTYEPYGTIIGTGKVNDLEGLAIKTYQSDIFNNWLSTEWIDGENGISAITSIDTSEGKFSIDTLNLAKRFIHSLMILR